MSVSHQLPIPGKFFQGFMFPLGTIIRNVFKHPRFENKKRTVDPAVCDLWFFGESYNPVPVQFNTAEPFRRMDRGQGCELPVGTMKIQKIIQVNVLDLFDKKLQIYFLFN